MSGEEDDEESDVKTSGVGGFKQPVSLQDRAKEVRQSLPTVTSHPLTGLSDTKDAAPS